MRFYAVVPARSGSKGLPNKNTKLVGGIELMVHSIGFAKTLGVHEIICSTDSEAYAEIARKAGAVVPGLRSPAAAADEAMEPAVIDDLDRMLRESGLALPDALVWLRPTFVFRSVSSVKACMAEVAGGRQSSRVVIPTDSRVYGIEGDRLLPRFDDGGVSMVRRQGLPRAFHVFNAEVFRYPQIPCPEDYLGTDVGWHEAPKLAGLDVDDAEDLEIVRAAYEARGHAVLP